MVTEVARAMDRGCGPMAGRRGKKIKLDRGKRRVGKGKVWLWARRKRRRAKQGAKRVCSSTSSPLLLSGVGTLLWSESR